jgi:DNA-binding transcriptional LysR family regulator
MSRSPSCGAGLESFAHEALRNEPYVLFVAGNHKLCWGWTESKVGELAGETMIVRRQCEGLPEISRYFTNRDVRPSFSFRTLNDDRAMSMVAADLGVTVAPSSFAADGLSSLPLDGLSLNRQISVVYSDQVGVAEKCDAFVCAARYALS